MRSRCLVWTASIPIVLGGCGASEDAPPASAATTWFEEDARASGLRFEHQIGAERRFHFPEIMGAGVGLADVDGDDDLDVYLVQSGDLLAPGQNEGDRLFANRGDGTFEDVTSEAGLGCRDYGMGCAFGDVDGDGDADLFVTNWGPDRLYLNAGGGTFEDVTDAAGLGDPGWNTSAVFFDLEGDGDLDLFVVAYVDWSLDAERSCGSSSAPDYCHPNRYDAPLEDHLYRNRGDGTFEDVTSEFGIHGAANGLGVVCADLTGDDQVDVYVANDMHANQLWVRAGGGFVDRALLSGCALSGSGFLEAGMGVQAFDFEEDGDLDLMVAHLWNQTHTLYLNDAGQFEDATARMGLAGPTLPFTGFGLGLADFDHDGDRDCLIANGRVNAPYPQPDQLLEQTASGRFVDVPNAGLESPIALNGRGVAFGDLDADGDVDAIIANNGGPALLLRNVASKRGDWVQFDVRNAAGGPAVGALVELEVAGQRLSRRVDPGFGYCSSNDPRVHFGVLGPIDDARVQWPDGRTSELGPLEAGRLHRVSR